MLVSRPTFGGAFLAVLLSLGLTETSHSTPQSYSFEGLAAGTVVFGQLPNGQILPGDVYAPFDISVEAVNVPNSLTIFDSANPTGGDFDLGTPNEDFGGPGRGDGGQAGMPGENRIPQGKVLIIPQNLTDVNHDGRIDAPNDNHEGGVITIQWPQKGLMTSMTFIDIEEFGASVDLYEGDQLVQSFPIPPLGDNSQVMMNTQTNGLIDRTVVTLPGSGALAVMVFDAIGCLPPKCNVDGVGTACVGSLHTFTTVAGPEFTRIWSTSGPCAIEGPNNGSSVDVRFNGAGACTVSLTVIDPTNPQDCTSVCDWPVDVTIPPCGVSGDQNVCVGTSAHYFTDVGAGYNKQWSFSSTPGGICNVPGPADGDTVEVNFTAAGQCTLTLTVSDPNNPEECRTTCDYLVDVNPEPTCTILGPSPVCEGSTGNAYSVTVAPDDGTIGYFWTVTGGSVVGSETGSSVSVTAGPEGTMTVHVDITRNGCAGSCEIQVPVEAPPPCDITGDSVACVGDTLQFTTAAPADWMKSWSVTSTPPGIASFVPPSGSGQSVDVAFTGAGTCTLSVDVSFGDDSHPCRSQCLKIVTVNPLPSCDFTGDLNACVGSTRTYTAVAGPGHFFQWSATSTPADIGSIPGSTTDSSVDVNFTGAGTCTLSLTVTDMNEPGCTSTCEQVITVATQPPCTISGDEVLCAGAQGTYSTVAASGFTKSWSAISVPPGIWSFDGATDGPSVTVNVTGAGTVTLSVLVFDPSDPEGCRSTCDFDVEVSPKPTCSILGPSPVCQGSAGNTYSVTVAPDDGTIGYFWTVTGGSIVGSETGSSVSVTAGPEGTMTVHVDVTRNGCAGSCEIEVPVSPLPSCDFTGDLNACIGSTQTYTAAAGAGHFFQWSATSTPAGIGTIPGSTTDSSVDVNFTGAGTCTLSLTVTDMNEPGCTSTCDQVITVAALPPCDISGEELRCIDTQGTYSTAAGNGLTKIWSATSTPDGICEITGPTGGSSVDVNFTGAGTCTLSVIVFDPADPENCRNTCTLNVTVASKPPCDVSGDPTACIGATKTYSTSAGPGYSRQWSLSSVPDGMATIDGSPTGASVDVQFTGAGTCTVWLAVTDPDNPENCASRCSTVVTVTDCPKPEPGACWMTGGGCLNPGGDQDGHKNHTFGGNVGPQPSGSWEHIVRQGNNIEFNFHSWDASSDSCWKDDGEGPCSPASDNNNINFSGTGLYSDGHGHHNQPATFRAHVEDRGESGHGPGQCGGKDDYEITVYDLSGNVVFHTGGELDCGNLQIHDEKAAKDGTEGKIPTPSGSNPEVTPIVLSPASPNPFQSTTRIAYSVRSESGAPVTVSVFDVSGRQVRRLVDRIESSGDHETVWDGRTDDGETVTGGIYFIRVASADAQAITRVLFAR